MPLGNLQLQSETETQVELFLKKKPGGQASRWSSLTQAGAFSLSSYFEIKNLHVFTVTFIIFEEWKRKWVQDSVASGGFKLQASATYF